MIPSISETSPVQAQYLAFIQALKAYGFEGDLNPDYANRTVLATDNSIYQVLPQGVLYPKNANDLVRVVELSNLKKFQDIVLSPRGGGTGTNGQSLTDGLVIDVSKYMNRIIEINIEERWVKVQSGVVKDQLNAALKPHGLFFAPELSTSNRATIGGMINTDASGQGSCLYGKTRDHVLSLTTVFLDGTQWQSTPVKDEEFKAICARQDRVGELCRVLNSIDAEYKDAINEKFPKLNRCLTGYDLAHIRTPDGRFDLNSILCGAEGTLGFIADAKLNLLPIPKFSALVNIQYENFNAALRDANKLTKSNPTSIETIDSKVLNLAMDDIIWDSVSEYFNTESDSDSTDSKKIIQGINLVEFTADNEALLTQNIKNLTQQLDSLASENNPVSIGYSVAMGSKAVNKIWAMRKKAVGLLGNAQGEARPIPFVEDTAVPPENLADFILEFRELLDSHQLEYGMFGHVDAGVLHVRPAIDMKDPQQVTLIRKISDQVVALTQKYHGLLWGEHGKGVRSEYAPAFFGDLYPQLQRIKAICDPHNQLNPGKIATPKASIALLKIDEVSTRGEQDRKIPVQVWDGYSEAMYCNGNGVCFNWDPNDAMCPSWKGTRQRTHSPKGRASLIREWLTQLSERNINPITESQQIQQQNFFAPLPSKIKNTIKRQQGDYDFSNEVMDSMEACLACKSCVAQCPIKVDVPEFRSKFLELYYGRYLRPLKDYFIGGLEFFVPYLARIHWLYNGLIKPKFMQSLLASTTGMVDSPKLSGINLDNEFKRMGISYATPEYLNQLSDDDKKQSVVLVQDAFTSFFDTQVVIDSLMLLQKLGFKPLVSPFKANGKPLHVHGFLKQFNKTANNTADFLNSLSSSGVALIGIEPSMTLAYQSEYKKLLGDKAPTVLLIQQWLSQQNIETKQDLFNPSEFKLLAHCTEKTNAPTSIKDWVAVFEKLNQNITVMDTGCCGMSGTYGHEKNNLQTSKNIYQLSWSGIVNNSDNQNQLIATGYSCRSQVQREDKKQLPHPLQALLQQST